MFFNLVDQKPIRLDVALPIAVIVPRKGMIAVFGRELLLMDKEVKYRLKVFRIAAAFDCLCVVFLEAASVVNVKP